MEIFLRHLKNHRAKVFIGSAVILVTAGLLVRSEAEEAPELFAQAVRGPFQATITTPGELRAKNSVKIYGPAKARQHGLYQIKVQKMVTEGSVLQKGDFVAELDRSELTTKIQSAQLELDKAQSQHEQTQLDTLSTLTKARDEIVNLRYAMEEAKIAMEQAKFEAPSVQRQAEISYEKSRRKYEQTVDLYETQVRQSDAKMREVEATLKKAQNDVGNLMGLAGEFSIVAPEDGMVIYTRSWNGKVEEGSMLHMWDPVVAELPDLSLMESITYVNEVDIQKVKVGQHVDIGLDAAPEKKLTGVVTTVANVGEQRPNSDSKVFEVIVMVNESDTTLRPAMTTSNTILVYEEPEALKIPLESVHAIDTLTYVFSRNGGRTVRKQVALGKTNENEVVVLDGVEDGQEVYLSMPLDTTGLQFEALEGIALPDSL